MYFELNNTNRVGSVFIPRKFGVEIEGQRFNRRYLRYKLHDLGVDLVPWADDIDYSRDHAWQVVPDQSTGGFELISPILQGTQGLHEACSVQAFLRDMKAGMTDEHGLHVHIDAHDLSLNQAKRVLARYKRFESIIDRFMQPSRRESVNRFCLSLQSYDYAVDVDTKERRMRSWKVSLRSFERLGTIEFRHHRATLSTHALRAWVLFLQSFVATSLEVADEQADQDLWSPLPEAIALYYLDRLTGRSQE